MALGASIRALFRFSRQSLHALRWIGVDHPLILLLFLVVF
ncbi:MAG: hypothetical protein AVDCRST_MAG01-01-1785 [uncultured Rubrobacteraceae bacterium]|uniref:Uncharacterized protein n=1 Tax=uncultured Rubrobacteraceae bacterium TaxID=349277 RepID=A0A6J4PHM4_9ACTN|nr:MAG: hypothetical protein AVDCRST_MAG01-01-1785 [uncultured Rubrobacteraceae bacterium]